MVVIEPGRRVKAHAGEEDRVVVGRCADLLRLRPAIAGALVGERLVEVELGGLLVGRDVLLPGYVALVVIALSHAPDYVDCNIGIVEFSRDAYRKFSRAEMLAHSEVQLIEVLGKPCLSAGKAHRKSCRTF